MGLSRGYEYALRIARKAAKRRGETMFIVFEQDDDYGRDYWACDGVGLDSSFLGSPVVAEIEPDGTITNINAGF